jgi:F-type H+-transporting ATPase subunit b
VNLALASAPTAILLFLQEEGGHSPEKFLGIPLSAWQLINLVLFLAVLIYFVAKPMSAAFRARQLEVEKRAKDAEHRRAEVDRLTREIEDRTVRLEREIEEIRRQGVKDGEAARAELVARADAEVERTRKEAQDEIARRLAEAKAELRRSAAALTAERASEILSKEITADDRRRLIDDGVDRLKQVPQ